MTKHTIRSEDGSITDLGDGRKRVRVTIGYDPKTGKQVRVSKTVRGNRKDAIAVRDRLKRDAGLVTAAYGKMSVSAFVLEEWLPTRRLRPTTKASYLSTIECHIVPRFSGVRLEELTPTYVRRTLASIEHPGGALNVYKMLRAALNFAVDEDMLPKNPMDRVAAPVLDPYEADVYTLTEILTVLDFLRGDAIEAGIIIAATCGLRASETCAQDWQDLILQRDTLEDGSELLRGAVSVTEGYHRVAGERVTTAPKSKRSTRVVALPGFAVARLLEIRGAARIGPIMVDSTGQRMTPNGLSSRWRRNMLPRRNKAGEVIYQPPVRYVELKNLRHSQTTIMLDEGATMHEVSLRAGHANERVTDERYNKATRVAADHDVAAIMDRAASRIREGQKTAAARPNSS